MVATSHSPALGYMQIVPRRHAATLLPIIQTHTAQHTTIHSDEWAAYHWIQRIPTLNLEVINHSFHFVDPTTKVHTQHVESYWNRVNEKTEAYERVPCRRTPVLFGWIHVAREAWTQCWCCLPSDYAGYSHSVSCLNINRGPSVRTCHQLILELAGTLIFILTFVNFIALYDP